MSHVYKGKKYKLTELAVMANIDINCLYARISRNAKKPKEEQLSFEDLVFNFKPKYNSKSFTVDGVTIVQKEIGHVRYNKLVNDPELLSCYLKHGEKVFERGKRFKVDGEYLTTAEISEKYNIRPSTFIDRYLDHKDLKIESILGKTPNLDRRKTFDKQLCDPMVLVNGKRMHITKAAKKLGTTVNTLYRYRRRKGNVDMVEVMTDKGHYSIDTKCNIAVKS